MTDSVVMNTLNAQANTVPTVPYSDGDNFIFQQTRLSTAFTLAGTIKDLGITIRGFAGEWDASYVVNAAGLTLGQNNGIFTNAGLSSATQLTGVINSVGSQFNNAEIGISPYVGTDNQWFIVAPTLTNIVGLQEYKYFAFLTGTDPYDFFINGVIGLAIGYDAANPSQGLVVISKPANTITSIDSAYTPGQPFMICVTQSSNAVKVVTPNGSFDLSVTAPVSTRAYLAAFLESNTSSTYSLSLNLSTSSSSLYGLTVPGGFVPWNTYANAPIPEGAYDTQRWLVTAPGKFVSATFGTIALEAYDVVTFANNTTDIYVERFVSDDYIETLVNDTVVPSLSQFIPLGEYGWNGTLGSIPTVQAQGFYTLTTEFLWMNPYEPTDTGPGNVLYHYAGPGSLIYCVNDGFSVLKGSDSARYQGGRFPENETHVLVHDVTSLGSLWSPSLYATISDVGVDSGQFEFFIAAGTISSFNEGQVVGIYLPFDCNGGEIDASQFGVTPSINNVHGVLAASPYFFYIDLYAGTLNVNTGSGVDVIATGLQSSYTPLTVDSRITFVVSNGTSIYVYIDQTLIGNMSFDPTLFAGLPGFTYFQANQGSTPIQCNTGQKPFAYGVTIPGSNNYVAPVGRYVPGTKGRNNGAVTNGTSVYKICTSSLDKALAVTINGDGYSGRVFTVTRQDYEYEQNPTELAIINSGTSANLAVNFAGFKSYEGQATIPVVYIPAGTTYYYRLNTNYQGSNIHYVTQLGKGSNIAPAQSTALGVGLKIDYRSSYDTYNWILTTDFNANSVTVGLTINGLPDRTVNVVIQQDGTGGHAFIWPTGWKFPGGVVPTVSQAANAIDVFTLVPLVSGSGSYVSPVYLVLPLQNFE